MSTTTPPPPPAVNPAPQPTSNTATTTSLPTSNDPAPSRSFFPFLRSTSTKVPSSSNANKSPWSLPSILFPFSNSNSNRSSNNLNSNGEAKGGGGGIVPKAFRNQFDQRPYVEGDYRRALRDHAPVVITAERKLFDELALVLYKKLDRGKHRRRIHSYEESFWGKDAVDYLVAMQITVDAQDGKNALRILLRRRVIMRVDHTRPFFNDALYRVAPQRARFRAATLEFKHSVTETEFRTECLYTFNPAAFCKERVVVTVVGAKGLSYKSRLSLGPMVLSAKFNEQRINGYAKVSLQDQTFQTSIVHHDDSESVRWDEEFSLLISFEEHRNADLWVRVYDFDEVLEDYELGMLCVPMKAIRENCGNGSKRWHFSQLLLPASELNARIEEAHGEIELEIELRPFYAPNPEATVFPEARESYEDRLARLYENEEEGVEASHELGTMTDAARVVGAKAMTVLSGTSSSSGNSDRVMLSVTSVQVTGASELADVKDRFIWVEFKVATSSRGRTEDILWPTESLGTVDICGIPESLLQTSRVRATVYTRTNDFVKARLGEGDVPLRRFFDEDSLNNPEKKIVKDVAIVLRRSAAFKRDARKRVGTLIVKGAILRDSGSMGSGGDDETNGGGADSFETIELDPVLVAIRDTYTDPSAELPLPLKNVVIDKAKIPASLVRVCAVMLNTKSQLPAALAKAQGYTELKVGEWALSGSKGLEKRDSLGGTDSVLDVTSTSTTTFSLDAAAAPPPKSPTTEKDKSPTTEKDIDDAEVSTARLVRQESLRAVNNSESDGAKLPSAAANDEEDVVTTAVTTTTSLSSSRTLTGDEPPPTNPTRAGRVVEFIQPASSLVKATRVRETHTIVSSVSNRGLALEIVGQALDAPYGDSFEIWVLVLVEAVGDTESTVTVSMEVRFPKGRPFIGGAIESGALQGVKDTYTKWLRLLQVHTSKGEKRARVADQVAFELHEAKPVPFARSRKFCRQCGPFILFLIFLVWVLNIRISMVDSSVEIQIQPLFFGKTQELLLESSNKPEFSKEGIQEEL